LLFDSDAAAYFFIVQTALAYPETELLMLRDRREDRIELDGPRLLPQARLRWQTRWRTGQGRRGGIWRSAWGCSIRDILIGFLLNQLDLIVNRISINRGAG
jgi:hypothetical protein